MEYAIRTEKLVKKYGNGFTALDGVSLQIKKGQVVGYVGPNGAGKTTTNEIDRRIKETLQLVRLSEWEHKKIGTFSTGMQRRLIIAKAILHEPDNLILDEPVLGLDPEGIRDIRELIRQFRNEGMTVFLSSHLLGEVAEVCNTVVFLNKGKVVSSDSMDRIESTMESKWVDVKFLK